MATSDKKLIQITGRVIDRRIKQGLSNLRVEAWDKDLIVKNAIGSATTDQQGAFVIEDATGQLNGLFADQIEQRHHSNTQVERLFYEM